MAFHRHLEVDRVAEAVEAVECLAGRRIVATGATLAEEEALAEDTKVEEVATEATGVAHHRTLEITMVRDFNF